MAPKEKYYYIGRDQPPKNEPIDRSRASNEPTTMPKKSNELTATPKNMRFLCVGVIVGLAVSCGFVLAHCT